MGHHCGTLEFNGGIINCDRYTQFLTLYCTNGCEPRLSINNIKVFNKLALAYDSNGTPGIYSGNDAQMYGKRKRITGQGSIDTS